MENQMQGLSCSLNDSESKFKEMATSETRSTNTDADSDIQVGYSLPM
jgi:hypothetical protein